MTASHGQPKKVSPGFHSSGSKEIVCFHKEKEITLKKIIKKYIKEMNVFHTTYQQLCALNLKTTLFGGKQKYSASLYLKPDPQQNGR